MISIKLLIPNSYLVIDQLLSGNSTLGRMPQTPELRVTETAVIKNGDHKMVGYMALSPTTESFNIRDTELEVTGREIGRPNGLGSQIFSATISWLPGQVELGHVVPILSPSGDSISVEDPTIVFPRNNPFSPGERGMLYTNVTQPRPGYHECSLKYSDKQQSSQTVLTPEQIRQAEKLAAPKSNLVKEGELLNHKDELQFFFEYTDGIKNAHIGRGSIRDNQVVDLQPFLFAHELPNTTHVSTAGQPFRLEDGRVVFPFNRRLKEPGQRPLWGVSYMVLDADHPLERRLFTLKDSWLIPPPTEEPPHPTYENQLVSFASSFLPDTNHRDLLHVFYHDDFVCKWSTIAINE